ncbi:glutamate racemase [Spirulina major CS-329]|uniref:glutamate racemase n=1 Tax=Spirulina TaxID=1154 RepID=UPI00232F6D23|nr:MULTISPECIES: glutamate racemase [Spirulina]MDB9494196.1 glutamate racemase [Spirulina subsalsa CS-330]MDB9504791.1 glutamate racemase [Spirulina major CS-329]
MQHNRIGVFDSGLGGLTVFQALQQTLPHESILYFGDTARLPYGSRSKAEIVQFVREILTWMTTENTKMVIMACNTSSALALEAVRSEFPMPILGIILPGAQAAVHRGQRVGVIATSATVASQAYPQAIHEADPTVQVWQIDCPEFVPLIESDRIHDPYTQQVAQAYLDPLLAQSIDTLIYGCTHYPHLAPVLRRILPPTVRCINPATFVAQAAARELHLMGLHNTQPLAVDHRFGVSGDPATFAHLAQKWLNRPLNVEKVHLPTVQSESASVQPVDSSG